MTKFLSLLLFLNSFALVSLAQQPGIKGILKNAADKSPVAGATVVIFLENDSLKKVVKSTLTDSIGSFELTSIDSGSYFIEISSVGYQKLNVMAIKAVQEQQLIIENQNKRIAELEEKMEKVMKSITNK